MRTPWNCIRRVVVPVLALAAMAGAARAQDTTLHYPAARKGDVVDDYFGTSVPDPYRWLEDVDASETKEWVDAENVLTFAYLEKIPEREWIRQELTRLWNYARFSTPFRRGGHYFFFKNDGLQNQSVLYTVAALGDEPRVLLDPNGLSEDGTVAVNALAVSPDGGLLMYGTSASGSDWQEFHVRNVDTGADLPDTLKWIKFSDAAWTHDGDGFYYGRYPRPSEGEALQDVNVNQKLYYHRLGTPQSEDLLIYEQPDQPKRGFDAEVSDDGRYAVISVWEGTDERNRVYYIDLGAPARPAVDGKVVKLLDRFDATYDYVGNDGPVFYFQTNLDAPRYRLITVDTRSPARSSWHEVIPEGEDVLESVQVIDGKFVGRYMHDAHHEIRIYAKDGSHEADIELPTVGSVSSISGRPEDAEMFYSFESFLYPETIYRYDFATGRSSVFRKPKVDFDLDRYRTRQVFYRSKDGTRVPMYITGPRAVVLDGRNPTYLYGYGGFNISLTPRFSPSNLVWLEMGGIYAQPSLRGGGEYGEAWHRAGMFEHKQNVFDDFIAAAEYLVREGYASTPKLAVGGGSNGGLLVGAVMTQRPDLFGAALPAVGVMDMLRFQKFTIGWAWVSEYGSSDDAEEFPYLYAYSPYHNLKPAKYPATLVTTADHDDRVVPGHSFKFAARLQEVQQGDAPVLIRIQTKAGHGGGKPTSIVIQEQADRWAFLLKNLGMTTPAGPASR